MLGADMGGTSLLCDCVALVEFSNLTALNCDWTGCSYGDLARLSNHGVRSCHFTPRKHNTQKPQITFQYSS